MIREIAIVGSTQSGLSSLMHDLQNEQNKRLAHIGHITDNENNRQTVTLRFDEHLSHEDMDLEHHDAVLQVVDATRLEDSLMLTPSLVDDRHPLVIALTHYDRLTKTGHHLNIPRMQELIGVPVQVVSADSDRDIPALLTLLTKVASQPHSFAHPVVHGWEQENKEAYRAYVQGVLEEVLTHPKQDQSTRAERINRFLTRPLTGFPVLALILCFVFWATFAIGTPIQDWLQLGVDALHDWLNQVISPDWLRSLLADGIVQGVGSLLTALPNIIILFFFLSVMEDTGYMARVAYLMDGVMHAVGLHGRSFIPMLMGFDCNVPAIMAAKDIHSPQERALTMLMIPFMSCSARLPVYILFISIFFPDNKALVLGSLYLLGLLLSFLFAFIMRRTRWFNRPSDIIINELPAFRLPTARSIGRHIWYRVSDFLRKISTVVLIASVVIWVLQYFPMRDLSQIESSWLAAIGRALDPVMSPLGFDWKLSVCLLTGLPAKEAIAATFAILFNGDLSQAGITPVTAYAFLVFVLLYFPCVATITTLRREINWKWSTFTVFNSLAVAWLMAFIVHTLGTLLF
ncbi:MAG: ferrous iron transport protein B [Paludibacteraceae bacterium]|nr:ferrous iron transport protein B [Paludibacteraceae bacterium]